MVRVTTEERATDCHNQRRFTMATKSSRSSSGGNSTGSRGKTGGNSSSRSGGGSSSTRGGASGKRELINTGTDKRYVRRDSQGQFKESDDVGRSLSADRRRSAKTVVKPGQGDRGDQKRR